MINDRDRVLINHILEASEAILVFVKDISIVDFVESDLHISAVVKKFEVIGEAANRISTEAKTLLSDIPWKDVIGMRHVLIHDYMSIDAESVWNTIEVYLPQLMSQLEQYRFVSEDSSPSK